MSFIMICRNASSSRRNETRTRRLFNARSTFQSLCGTLLKTVETESKNGLVHLLVVQSSVDQVFVRQTLLPLQHCSQLELHSDVAVTQAAAGDLSVFMWTAERACAMLPCFFANFLYHFIHGCSYSPTFCSCLIRDNHYARLLL